MEEQYMSLITDYIDSNLSVERKREFDTYVAEGHIDMKGVNALIAFQEKIEVTDAPMPSTGLSENFYTMLNAEKAKANSVKSDRTFERIWQVVFGTNGGRLAFGMVVLIFGVVLGRGYSGSAYQSELKTLSSQVSEMQQLMSVAMLDGDAVSERLKGVQMSSELVSSNTEVTSAMFVTLNNDESTNVRMAALNLLAQYANDPIIREGLINSISQQESPLMQLAMAELMVELQEKKSVKEFNDILEDEFTPEEVKTTLRESVNKIM